MNNVLVTISKVDYSIFLAPDGLDMYRRQFHGIKTRLLARGFYMYPKECFISLSNHLGSHTDISLHHLQHGQVPTSRS